MTVEKTPQTVTANKDCMICFENFRLKELQSFQLEHSLHLACGECIKLYLDSLESAVVTCPYCTVFSTSKIWLKCSKQGFPLINWQLINCN